MEGEQSPITYTKLDVFHLQKKDHNIRWMHQLTDSLEELDTTHMLKRINDHLKENNLCDVTEVVNPSHYAYFYDDYYRNYISYIKRSHLVNWVRPFDGGVIASITTKHTNVNPIIVWITYDSKIGGKAYVAWNVPDPQQHHIDYSGHSYGLLGSLTSLKKIDNFDAEEFVKHNEMRKRMYPHMYEKSNEEVRADANERHETELGYLDVSLDDILSRMVSLEEDCEETKNCPFKFTHTADKNDRMAYLKLTVLYLIKEPRNLNCVGIELHGEDDYKTFDNVWNEGSLNGFNFFDNNDKVVWDREQCKRRKSNSRCESLFSHKSGTHYVVIDNM